MKKNLKKVIRYLIIINLLFLIVYSIYISFLPQNNQSLIKAVIGSPVYLFFWLFLFVILFLFPILSRMDLTHSLSHFRIHCPLLILFFLILVHFITAWDMRINLYEGDKIDINQIYELFELKSKDKSKKELVFERFKLKKVNYKDKNIDFYQSNFTFHQENQPPAPKTLAVNKPLKIDSFTLYLFQWGIKVNELTFEFNGKEYNIEKNSKDQILSRQGYIFQFYPLDIVEEDKVKYQWVFKNRQGEIVESGEFLSGRQEYFHPGLVENGFKIINESIVFQNSFKITYHPLKPFLALAAVFFLIGLILEFWGFDLLKRIGKKNHAYH